MLSLVSRLVHQETGKNLGIVSLQNSSLISHLSAFRLYPSAFILSPLASLPSCVSKQTFLSFLFPSFGVRRLSRSASQARWEVYIGSTPHVICWRLLWSYRLRLRETGLCVK